MMGKLYCAYGSNLHKASMRRRCPDAVPRGWFMLQNARLVFRGVADVEYSPNDKVPCGLWEISRRDEAALDVYEGVAGGLYFKDESIVLKYKGKRQHALIYLMNSEGVSPPSQGYADIILAGYRDFKMDEAYLEVAIKRSYLEKAPDEQTISRRERERKTSARRQLVAMPEAVARKRLELRAAQQQEDDYWNDREWCQRVKSSMVVYGD